MEMFGKIVRNAFHYIYTNHDVLDEFRTSNTPVIDDVDSIPDLPAQGDLDLDEVLESEFFFS